MGKDLTNSQIERQNILNNKYALQEIQDAVGIAGLLYNDEFVFTKEQLIRFFEIDGRTIERYISEYSTELSNNGYQVLRGKSLQDLKLWLNKRGATDIYVGSKVTQFGLFNFRAFLNIAMLLKESEKARVLRSAILDIVIDTINKKTGGGTKYINQRDEEFVINFLKGEDFRREFTDALMNYVDMGKIKYAIYTDKIYRSVFKENTQEYRQILKLHSKENIRETMYSEVLRLISSYEIGFAEELKNEFNKLGRKLIPYEVDKLFSEFEEHKLWIPQVQDARSKMASRDLGFRDALHYRLKEYISSIPPEDFEKFIGEKSKTLEEQLKAAEDVFKRLKDRQ
ncbi:MAG: DNA-binding protein [Bacteroidetes bacterium]|nr:DNA-binding protein [Bacteroidota bacterium]